MLNVCFSIVIVLLNYGSQVKDWIIDLGLDNYNLKYEDIGWRSGEPARHYNSITLLSKNESYHAMKKRL